MDWKRSRLLRVVVGAVIFGALMALRESLGSTWGRVLIAALAGGVLGLMIAGAKSKG